jgi:hypothetical protein
MPAGGTYEPIATNTLSSSQGTVTFASISASYTDLVLITVAKLASGTSGMKLRFNSDSGANYGNTYLYGSSSSQGSVSDSGTGTGVQFYYAAYIDSTNFAITTTNIMNYSNSTTHKPVISRDGSAKVSGTDLTISTWRNNSAINSIDILTGNANSFASGSTFTLYGIKAA